MKARHFARFLAVLCLGALIPLAASGGEPSPETTKPELSAEDRAHIEAWHQRYLATKIASRIPDYVKKADAAALQGNALMADGAWQAAQDKFLEALNRLAEPDRDRKFDLDRREAYARQLLVAIQAEQRALEKERTKKKEQ